MRQVDAAQGSGYIPTLDGMRAVSIALVVLGHFGRHVVDNDGRRGLFFLPGVFGVTIFFFISGYLITGHLLAEVDRTGTVSLPLFYLRRMLRLYPALLVMVTVGGVLFWALGGWLHGADVLSAVFYFVNIREILGGFITATPTLPHPYSVLWSLSVEEHYYLVFPLLVVLLARRRMAFIATLTVLILAGTAWRWHIAGLCLDGSCVEYRVEYGTDTRIDSILYGALLASLLCSRLQSQTLRITANLPALIVGLALILFSLADRDPWFRETERFTFQGIGLLLAMGAVLHGRSLGWARALLGWWPCLQLGRLSYSLYLWHWIVLCAAIPLLPTAFAVPMITMGMPPLRWLVTVCVPLTIASLALAALSYYGIERPMVSIRRRFGSNAIADAPATPVSHKAMATRAAGP